MILEIFHDIFDSGNTFDSGYIFESGNISRYFLFWKYFLILEIFHNIFANTLRCFSSFVLKSRLLCADLSSGDNCFSIIFCLSLHNTSTAPTIRTISRNTNKSSAKKLSCIWQSCVFYLLLFRLLSKHKMPNIWQSSVFYLLSFSFRSISNCYQRENKKLEVYKLSHSWKRFASDKYVRINFFLILTFQNIILFSI